VMDIRHVVSLLAGDRLVWAGYSFLLRRDTYFKVGRSAL
jgi:hypothetical protein